MYTVFSTWHTVPLQSSNTFLPLWFPSAVLLESVVKNKWSNHKHHLVKQIHWVDQMLQKLATFHRCTVPTLTVALFGHITEFKASKEDRTQFLEHLSYFWKSHCRDDAWKVLLLTIGTPLGLQLVSLEVYSNVHRWRGVERQWVVNRRDLPLVTQWVVLALPSASVLCQSSLHVLCFCRVHWKGYP